jgi:ribokinase
MTVWNLGSINLDHVYRVPHLPAPGETLAAEALASGLGGKGANQSIAAARAGARVAHIGRIGAGGGPAGAALAEAGVDVTHVTRSAQATGHAIILVDAAGENSIVIHPGANRDQQTAAIDAALSGAAPGDTLLLQNETDAQVAAAGIARAAGLRVVYSAAPFDADAARAVMPHVDLLALNTVEATALAAALGTAAGALPVAELLITRGSDGAWYRGPNGTVAVPGVPVTGDRTPRSRARPAPSAPLRFPRSVRLTGVSTASSIYMSPGQVPVPRSAGMPLPRSRIWRPDWLSLRVPSPGTGRHRSSAPRSRRPARRSVID